MDEVDWIITNPPYSILDEWIEHSCKLSQKGFAYLIGLNNITAKRLEKCEDCGFGLTNIHIFKVYDWFGMSSFLIFEREKKSIVTYDRTVWKEEGNIQKIKSRTNFEDINDYLK